MYKLIIESANKNKSESESRQLIIEYQKIIQSIVEKKEIDSAESLDLDVLLSASERCFKY